MFKKILVGVAVLLALLVVVIAAQPAQMRIQRSLTFAAPPGVAFDQVNEFSKWAAWSPWEKLDPAMKKEFTGPAAGVGASYHWVGNDKVGEGRMTILEAKAGEHVGIKLEFLKPWEATNPTTFDFAAGGAGVSVTWTMTGDNNFMAKAAGLFMNMDKMVGGDFERGLAALKAVSEGEAQRLQAAAAARKAADAPPATPEATTDAAPPALK